MVSPGEGIRVESWLYHLGSVYSIWCFAKCLSFTLLKNLNIRFLCLLCPIERTLPPIMKAEKESVRMWAFRGLANDVIMSRDT